MYLSQFIRTNCILKNNLTYLLHRKEFFFKTAKKLTSQNRYYNTLPNIKPNKNAKIITEEKRKNIYELIEKFEDKIYYSSVIENQKLKLGYKKNKAYENKTTKKENKFEMELRSIEPLPISLKYLKDSTKQNKIVSEIEENQIENDTLTQFPFEVPDEVIKDDNNENEHIKNQEEDQSIQEAVLARHADYENIKNNWMTDYENYDDKEADEGEQTLWQLNYGTPNPKSSVSNVPCGGCGALLHCKDTAIPGYIPSEIYMNHDSRSGQKLRTLICQRCHFLKYYDMALQVRVSPEEYPKILMKIRENPKALVILMVDILDFPCSIWPNIIDIIGHRRPVMVVGNKIDLLPQDSKGYLHRIQNILADSAKLSCLSKADIRNVSLISAKTGYGVEELITRLHSLWDYDGDVYLIGCTNVGKSTLFNTLLQSDYCKIQAVDLVQRATTSLWPGTTLNLLKFPILKPSGWRLYVRHRRLLSLNKIRSQEERLRNIQLRKTNNPKYAMLIGHIERSFSAEEPIEGNKDIFSVQGQDNTSGKVKIGINEKDSIYKLTKWCYDTPGVVHPDQILHLLTTEELVLTLPKQLIHPRTFTLRPGSTLFLAGLGRIDLIEGPTSMRFSVFASENLPITICQTSEADELYKELLGTEMFKVPMGSEKRLSKWPALESSEEIKLRGLDWESSCADIVLSSAGWVSVSCGKNIKFVLKAWTPGKKGLFVRNSILPKAVSLRGRRIRFSPAYCKSKFFIEQ